MLHTFSIVIYTTALIKECTHTHLCSKFSNQHSSTCFSHREISHFIKKIKTLNKPRKANVDSSCWMEWEQQDFKQKPPGALRDVSATLHFSQEESQVNTQTKKNVTFANKFAASLFIELSYIKLVLFCALSQSQTVWIFICCLKYLLAF